MKILAWDIEHGPNLGWIWGLYNQNISVGQIEERGSVLSVAARWVDEPKSKIHFFSDYHTGHHEMLEGVWQLVNEADALLSWNGKDYDTRKMNREWLLAGITPPSPIKQIDLLKVARSQFGFVSNKLENVAIELGLEGKLSNSGFKLWLACMQGDPKAWQEMARYNKQDVHLLIDVYKVFLPWITNHPNRNLYIEGDGCPICGASKDPIKEGFAYTGLGKYQRYLCKECGSWLRGKTSVFTTDLRRAP